MLRKAFYILVVVFLSIGTGFADEDNAKMSDDMHMGMEETENTDMMHMQDLQDMRQEMIGMMQMHGEMIEAGELPAMSPEMMEEMMSLMESHMALMKEHMGDHMMEGSMMGDHMDDEVHVEKDISIDMDSHMKGECSPEGDCHEVEEMGHHQEEEEHGHSDSDRAGMLEDYTPDVSYTLSADLSDGKMIYTGVGGEIDGLVNPTLNVQNDQVVEITLLNNNVLEHNIVFPDLDTHSEHVNAEVESTTLAFRIGDQEGNLEYYCSIAGHREAGMEGLLAINKAQENHEEEHAEQEEHGDDDHHQ